jgi:hypothetical protein
MKTVLIAVPPRLVWHPINILGPTWKEQFRQLIRERKPITFHLRNMTAILEFEGELDAQDYEHQILSSDCRRHFLVPVSR